MDLGYFIGFYPAGFIPLRFILTMNLILDIGNTSAKVGIFDGEQKVTSLRTRHFSCDKMEKTFAVYQDKLERAIVSTVRKMPEFIIDLATHGIPYVHILSHKSKLPFRNDYETPETLGPDRIAAVAGAHYFFRGKNILIIDAGSAVTFDFLTGNTYSGGNISPGLAMRFKSLHRFTDKLPLATTTEKYTSPGKSTLEALTAGVIDGLIFEINGYISSFQQRFGQGEVVLTGGDSGYLRERIGKEVNFMPDIVLEGLNYILEFNAK
jgi:type III pantothenate kinase